MAIISDPPVEDHLTNRNIIYSFIHLLIQGIFIEGYYVCQASHRALDSKQQTTVRTLISETYFVDTRQTINK